MERVNSFENMRKHNLPTSETPMGGVELQELNLNEEAAFDIADAFERGLPPESKDRLYSFWKDKYLSDPRVFFTDDSFKSLKEFDSVSRLFLLSFCAKSMLVTPKEFELYKENFPDDADAVVALFKIRDGMPQTSGEFSLFALAGEKISDDIKPGGHISSYTIDDWRQRAIRLRKAPDLLLNNFKQDRVAVMAQYGAAAEDFWRVYDEANNSEAMGGNYIIDPSPIFEGGYKGLTAQEQASFLRQILSYLHEALVFNEVYNSCFTEARVKEDNQRINHYNSYNVAHSMVYKTQQPLSVFDRDQSYFQWEMDSVVESGGAVEEYPFHRIILAVLEKLKDADTDGEQNIDVVVDFWIKNRNPIFGNGVAELLSKQDPNRAAQELLKFLQEEKQDKNPLTAILYRLEFGRVGISEEGVRYLERTYDLGEYNNPDYHVSRLTSGGEVGVFNEDLQLIKYFHLGDLSTKENRARAKVLDFTYETLFLARPGESAEERAQRMVYLEEFKNNYYRIAQDKMFSETGVRLNNLSFREQGWFLIYFSQIEGLQKERVQNFISTYKEEGLKLFLSLEQDMGMGERILDLAERLKTEEMEKVLYLYNNLANKSQRIEQEVDDNLATTEMRDFDTNKVTYEILKRAKEILAEAADAVAAGKTKELMERLEKVKVDLITFSAIFKNYFSEVKGGVDFSEIKGLDFERLGREDLDAQTVQEMIEFAGENWGGKGKSGERMVESLHKSLSEGSDSVFYILRRDGKIISFMRFDDEMDKPGHKYAASFNVDPEYKSGGIGRAMHFTAFENEAKKYILDLIFFIKDRVGTMYVEGGCLLTGVNEHSDFFTGTRDLKRSEKLKTLQQDQAEFVELFGRQKDWRALMQESAPVIVFRMDVEKENDELVKNVRELTAGGYVGTRYFYTDQKQSDERYFVFEKEQ